MNKSSREGGMGFLGILTLIFVVAKILHYIDWPWWMVFSPILIPATFIIVLLVIVGIAALKDR